MNFILFFLHGECKHALFQYIPVVVVAVQPRLFKRLIVLANKQAQCVVFIPFQLVQPRFYRDSARRYARTRFPTCIAPMSLHKIAEFALFANSAINR